MLDVNEGVTFCPINVRSILARIAGGQDVAVRKEDPVIERTASWSLAIASSLASPLDVIVSY